MTDQTPQRFPAVTELSFAVLGWLNRANRAVGSERFDEAVERTSFYLGRLLQSCRTPADVAIYSGLYEALIGLTEADAQARRLLAESVSGMNAAEATEFVELCEDGPTPQ